LTSTYDEAGRLNDLLSGYTDRNGASLGFAIDNDFTLDATGNRTSTEVDGGGAVSAEVDPNNQLADDGTYTYEYDAEGNLKRRDSNSDNSYTLYTWDHRNRLIKVEHYNVSGAKIEQIDYRYNSDDLRVRRTVSTEFDGSGDPANGVAEHFVYDGDQVALNVEADGDVDHRYLYAGTDELLVDEEFNDTGTTGQALRGYWALTDHAGTVHDLVESDVDGNPNNNHKLVQHLDYDPLGPIARAINNTVGTILLDALLSTYAFAGREWDGLSEL
jgi:YD repeat-containing protein